jgi:F-type H+-transporting ATPase subunit gamma
MAVGKEIRTKITSIQSTQKITSAMEMVAASKMRKAQESMAARQALRAPYPQPWSVTSPTPNRSTATSTWRSGEVKRVGFIVVSTDRGLCGGLNINLFKATIRAMKEWAEQDIEIDLSLIGAKAMAFFNSYGGNVVAALRDIGEEPSLESLIGGVKTMLDAYADGRIDRLFLVSNEFVNTMTQSPTVAQLLPLPAEDDGDMQHHWDYIYEPEARDLLDGLLTRYIESQVYQAVVENAACEQAARMLAMKNATENAGELIDELQLVYNKARQAAITQELSEIVGGAAAIS